MWCCVVLCVCEGCTRVVTTLTTMMPLASQLECDGARVIEANKRGGLRQKNDDEMQCRPKIIAVAVSEEAARVKQHVACTVAQAFLEKQDTYMHRKKRRQSSLRGTQAAHRTHSKDAARSSGFRACLQQASSSCKTSDSSVPMLTEWPTAGSGAAQGCA